MKDFDFLIEDYVSGTFEEEKKKIPVAISNVVENLKSTIENYIKLGFEEQAEIYSDYIKIAEDPGLSGVIYEKLEENINAPKAVLEAAESNAEIFEEMEDEYFSSRADVIRQVGKIIAKFIVSNMNEVENNPNFKFEKKITELERIIAEKNKRIDELENRIELFQKYIPEIMDYTLYIKKVIDELS